MLNTTEIKTQLWTDRSNEVPSKDSCFKSSTSHYIGNHGFLLYFILSLLIIITWLYYMIIIMLSIK